MVEDGYVHRLGLVAYTDESGNTGNNLFDPNQPWFWTGTLLAPSDFDHSAFGYMSRWRERLDVDELHGSEIGLHRLERIAHGFYEIKPNR